MRTIPDSEDLQTEFKSDLALLPQHDIIEAVVGLCNTKGGILYLGVEDDGRITGVNPKRGQQLVGVMALIANSTRPAVSTYAEVLHEEGHDVLKIYVQQAQSLVATSGGKTLRRRLKVDGTPENVPIFPDEYNSRLSELGALDFSGQILAGSTLNDFDPNERVRLRRMIARLRGDTNLLDLNDEDLDKALRLVKEKDGELYPTLTGMLLIGKEERIDELIPTAKSSFQVLTGTQVRVNEESSQSLLAVFERFEMLLSAWNPERETEIGFTRVPIPEFSAVAFREALVNAFSHRDYTILGRVRVLIEDSGLTISSPGGFIDGISFENLLTVEPHGRNPILADALKRIGLAEKTGRGIDRIYEGSIYYGRPWPDYSGTSSRFVQLFISRAKADVEFIKMLREEESRLGQSLSFNVLLILSALLHERRANIAKLNELTYIVPSKLTSTLEELIESGLTEARGNGRSRSYTLGAKVYRATNNSMGYVRLTGIESIRFEELVLKLAREQEGRVTKSDVKELLNITDYQALALIKKLLDENKLSHEGVGRSSKYVLISVESKDD